MMHRGTAGGGRPGFARRIIGAILFIVLLPVILAVALLMLPLIVLARVLGFGPPRRFAGSGCRGRKHRRGPGGPDEGEATQETGSAAQT